MKIDNDVIANVRYYQEQIKLANDHFGLNSQVQANHNFIQYIDMISDQYEGETKKDIRKLLTEI